MPLFFIDTHDDALVVRDEVGMELSDVGAARSAALTSLPEMAADAPPDGQQRRRQVQQGDRDPDRPPRDLPGPGGRRPACGLTRDSRRPPPLVVRRSAQGTKFGLAIVNAPLN